MLRRPLHLLLTGLVAAALGSACSDDEPAADRSATTTTQADSTTATEPAAETTTTAAQAAAAIVLRGDGLGVTVLGATPDDAVAAVTEALGPPTRDTGWQPSSSEYGTCPGDQIRGVEWDHLVLLFTDSESAVGSGEHLFAWRVTGAPPAIGTETGLGFEATVADAEELHPGAVTTYAAEEPFPAHLEIAAEGGPITAYLDGEVITNLEAGVPCGE